MPADTIDPFENLPLSEKDDDLIMGKASQQLSKEQVRAVINKHDPMGLLRIGAPEDEYDLEVKDIVTRRNECNMRLDPDEIRVIFEYWFYPNCISNEQATTISSELQALFMGK
jgi:hypothetical protein